MRISIAVERISFDCFPVITELQLTLHPHCFDLRFRSPVHLYVRYNRFLQMIVLNSCHATSQSFL